MLTNSVCTVTASKNYSIIRRIEDHMSTTRGFHRSTIAPPAIINTALGTPEIARTIPIARESPVSFSTNQGNAMIVRFEPIMETTEPSHSNR